jgi:TPP-dependent pyruvate/acetoin dehydrogenase alpha subunit
MIAELYGKATGCAKGKGGSMHLIDVRAGVMGTSAVVGTTIPHAVGYAYAMRLRRKDTVVASFFGDGAIDEGVFHESMNFAALRKLPIIFVCENNSYAIHSHQLARQPAMNIVERARTYSILAERVEDNDVLRIYDLVKPAADEIRSGKSGPRFFECMTYRWKEHVGPNDDFDKGYRSISEAQPWFANDQLKRLESLLEPQVRAQIIAEVEAELERAFEFAESSPFPAEEELYTDMFEEAAQWTAS